MRGLRVEDAYRLAWRHARHLPAPVGYALAHAGADLAWALHRLRGGGRGVGQLERNLARILPAGTTPAALHRASRRAMRSYMRYFYEAFALPGLSREQVEARMRTDLADTLRPDLQRGSVVLALPHMGNWDLAGAWASAQLATVLTVAERLEPADLFEQFVDFRQGLGMEVIGQGRGEKVFERLVQRTGEGHYLVALLADRDLSSSGIQAELAGHTARVAAGPAALDERLGLPLYTATIHYERLTGTRRTRAGGRWGIVLTVRKVEAPAELTGRRAVTELTRAWVAELSEPLAAHAIDWHMLQPVFDDDLDHERLARRHAREQEETP